MELYTVTKLDKLIITVDEGCSSVNGIKRLIGLKKWAGNEEIEVTLSGDEALTPLEVNQRVIAVLRWESCRINGEQYDEYYALSIMPLSRDAVIEETESDWERYCRN